RCRARPWRLTPRRSPTSRRTTSPPGKPCSVRSRRRSADEPRRRSACPPAANDKDRQKEDSMTEHPTGTREEWLAARLELLEAEKELTRRGDELARQRQQLPWVKVDKDYRFETDEGGASLADLFKGRSQLLIYHF